MDSSERTSVRWYYLHAGVTHGPFSEEEVNTLIARKGLLESDPVWPENIDHARAAPAGVIFDFAGPATSARIPDWLADVAGAECSGQFPTQAQSSETPEWLEDLRLWVGLELYSPTSAATENVSSGTGAMPDWLEGWLSPEKPKSTFPQPPPSAPSPPPVAPQFKAPAAASLPAPPSSIPVASPPHPHAPPTLTVPAPVSSNAPVAPPSGRQHQTEAKIPSNTAALSVAPPATKAPALVKTQPNTETRPDPRVEEMKQASGFDPETGQILDVEKFRKWQQQQAHPANSNTSAVSNASLLEVFRTARIAIETWVDDEKTRNYIMHSAPNEIKTNPEVEAILRRFANYGESLKEKLLLHLAFMVENRRKYYLAIEGRYR